MGFLKEPCAGTRTKPDGQPRRCPRTLVRSREFGWWAKTSLRDDIRKTINWFCNRIQQQAAFARRLIPSPSISET